MLACHTNEFPLGDDVANQYGFMCFASGNVESDKTWKYAAQKVFLHEADNATPFALLRWGDVVSSPKLAVAVEVTR